MGLFNKKVKVNIDPREEERILWCPKCNKIPEETIGGKFKIIDTDDWNFRVQEHRATMERRKGLQDFLAKYGPLIGLAFVVVLFIIAIYFSYEFLDKQFSRNAEVCKEIYISQQQASQQNNEANVPIISGLIKPTGDG